MNKKIHFYHEHKGIFEGIERKDVEKAKMQMEEDNADIRTNLTSFYRDKDLPVLKPDYIRRG